ncbi:hypothetical protein F4821DRAFT_56851 [Hypoxylon rubiginosum]|uniref:Uncharacterized protein n=1 Tax=Hypoxylon rubiginosum TaxID=110542 RepID=A0ACC0D9U1_9PEZI|nr:hypothetical protein F4821DRAFT_56851 [Hypoxylon rubiginosum]
MAPVKANRKVPKASGRGTGKKPRESPAAKAARLRKERAAKAAEKEAAREEEKRKRRKQVEKLEKPTDSMYDSLALTRTQTEPHKRPADDDCADDDRGKNKRARLAEKLERPPSPSYYYLNSLFASMSLDPLKALGTLAKLPTEVRDDILRNILISNGDIRVFRDWSLVYPRKKPGLDLAILRTCRVLQLQGLRILFGENTFLYDIRDPANHLPHTHRIIRTVFDNCVVPIAKYGHLVRHIKIHVSSNRLTLPNIDKFAKAINKFGPSGGLFEPANLHTLTLEFPAWFGDADSVQAWSFFTPGVRDALVKLNVQFIRVVAMMPGKKARGPYEYVVDLRSFHKQKQMENSKTKATKHEKERLEAAVRTSKAQLYNIPHRLFELTISGLEKANEKKVFWTEVEKPQKPATHSMCTYARSRRQLANLTTQPSRNAVMEWLEGIEIEA